MSKPTEIQKRFHRDYSLFMKEFCENNGDLDAMSILALQAYIVGQSIALQDQTKVTPEMAMRCVVRNIELGNKHVIDGVMASVGNA